jgi:hypothetical protein
MVFKRRTLLHRTKVGWLTLVGKGRWRIFPAKLLPIMASTTPQVPVFLT